MTGERRWAAVRFANCIAWLEVGDSVGAHVGQLLQHCRADELIRNEATSPDDPTFDFSLDTNQTRTLRKNGEILGAGLPAPLAVERLLYEITIALGTACRSALVFHAAGLAMGNGGVILCGASGYGKSTLATWLIREGFDFLSDELVAVTPDGCAAIGFPRPIALKDLRPFAGPEWCVLDSRPPEFPRFDGLIHLDPEVLRSGSLRAEMIPSALIFPHYEAAAPLTIRRLTEADTAFRLMHRLVNPQSFPGRGFSRVASLARILPSFELHYGDTIQAIAAVRRVLGESREILPHPRLLPLGEDADQRPMGQKSPLPRRVQG